MYHVVELDESKHILKYIEIKQAATKFIKKRTNRMWILKTRSARLIFGHVERNESRVENLAGNSIEVSVFTVRSPAETEGGKREADRATSRTSVRKSTVAIVFFPVRFICLLLALLVFNRVLAALLGPLFLATVLVLVLYLALLELLLLSDTSPFHSCAFVVSASILLTVFSFIYETHR